MTTSKLRQFKEKPQCLGVFIEIGHHSNFFEQFSKRKSFNLPRQFQKVSCFAGLWQNFKKKSCFVCVRVITHPKVKFRAKHEDPVRFFEKFNFHSHFKVILPTTSIFFIWYWPKGHPKTIWHLSTLKLT